MEKTPIISVVMAVYNTEKFLKKSVQSVIDQTFSEWELICVNDGSTDNSLTILNEFSKTDNRIRIYSQENSGRHAVPLNRAVSLSTGKYVFSLDSDDYISNDLLEKTYNRIIETGADLCLPDLYFINEQGDVQQSIIGLNNDRSKVLSNKQAVALSLDWTIHAVGLWNSSILKKNKFDEDGFSVEYSARVRLLNCISVVFSEGAYFYIQHNKATTKKFGMRQFYYVELDYKVKKLLKENHFENNVIEKFEWQRVQRLVSVSRLYFCSLNLLSKEEREKIKEIIRKSFFDINIQLCRNELNLLSAKKRFRYLLNFSNFYLFRIYCFLKK